MFGTYQKQWCKFGHLSRCCEYIKSRNASRGFYITMLLHIKNANANFVLFFTMLWTHLKQWCKVGSFFTMLWTCKKRWTHQQRWRKFPFFQNAVNISKTIMQVSIFFQNAVKGEKGVERENCQIADFPIIFVSDCLKDFIFHILLLVILKQFQCMHQPTLLLSDKFQQFVEPKSVV